MSASKADKYRYWLAWFPNDMEVGAVFQSGALHLTILTWFVSENTEDQLVESFLTVFDGRPAFDITLGSKTILAARTPVNLVISGELPRLHQAAMDWFEQNHCRWAVKNPYAGQQFLPHIRRRRGSRLTEGQTLEINSLSLVRAQRREDNRRFIAAKAYLR